MRLNDLTATTAAANAATLTGPDVDITGLTADSRAVKPGFLFAALPGSRADGRAFIADALAGGAAAILLPAGTTLPRPVPDTVALLADPNPRRRFALLAAAFFARQPAVIAAVTGTNGKTSTAHFCRQIWAALGHQAGAIGTLGVVAPGIDNYFAMTTPDPVELHRILADLAGRGVDHVALEASSHGLHQHRLDGVHVSVAGFTNLSRDHLDYHGDMTAYLDAKAALFDRVLPAGAAAVINADAPEFAALAAVAAGRDQRVIGYGLHGREITVRTVTPDAHGQQLDLTLFGRPVTLSLPLAGRFQAWNVLCALGMVIGAGADPDAALAAAATVTGVHGRLELVGHHPAGAAIYVDFAHSPDALETVLRALRPHATGRLIVVFGCGGDRDRGKRPVMGELAARLADIAIVTDDNPRTEDAAAIRREVMAGCPGALEIGDRHAAIRHAVSLLTTGDVLLLAGKGHEHGQIVGTEVRPFDDSDEARAALAAVTGEPDPAAERHSL